MNLFLALTTLLTISSTSATTVTEIVGNSFLSPLKGKPVTDIRGVVTAVGPNGFFLRDTVPRPANSVGSNSIYVFGRNVVTQVAAGDAVNVGAGTVAEYRSKPQHLFLTELINPTNITVLSRGNTVNPISLGRAARLMPPSQAFSALDAPDGVFGVPNGVAKISESTAPLQPTVFGLDFWESLTGELVTVATPTALSKSSQFGDVWIRGEWTVTGLNRRGGLTITARGNANADANPEAIMIGSPLDGTKSAPAKVGDKLASITGVVTYAFGFYRILPTTAISVTRPQTPDPGPSLIRSSRSCSGLTLAQYNVENLAPTSPHLPRVADQIVNILHTPDLIFLQEVQDDSGPTNDGVTSAGATLTALRDAVAALPNGLRYDFVDIAPLDGRDGGQPGGNIRTAYFWNPALLSLQNRNPGSATTGVRVLVGPRLSINPGRIAPADAAWTASRKPLVAAFNVVGSEKPLFAVNVHFGSKGGSSSIHGDPRPPLNGGVEDRTAQARLTARFISELLVQDPNAMIAAVGDFNEFSFVDPMRAFDGVMREMDEIMTVPPTERYTYVFDMNCQQLDHMLVSRRLGERARQFEHVHVSSWAEPGKEVSDHDPSVGLVNVCG